MRYYIPLEYLYNKIEYQVMQLHYLIWDTEDLLKLGAAVAIGNGKPRDVQLKRMRRKIESFARKIHQDKDDDPSWKESDVDIVYETVRDDIIPEIESYITKLPRMAITDWKLNVDLLILTSAGEVYE